MSLLSTQSSYTQRIKAELKSLAHAFIIVMVVRTFFYQPFIIPSESMYPTLMIGDFLFVSKLAYGYSNRTFPFAPPLIQDRLFAAPPKRGDVVVFHNPKHLNELSKPEPLDYIKRLIGLPGDTVQVINGIVHINDKAAKLERVDDYEMVDGKGRFQIVPRYIETLPNGVKHPILKAKPFGSGWLDNTEVFKVPPGHYFMMGDNRDNSADSRVTKAVGFIPSNQIIGRADCIIASNTGSLWKPWTWLNFRWERWPHLIR